MSVDRIRTFCEEEVERQGYKRRYQGEFNLKVGHYLSAWVCIVRWWKALPPTTDVRTQITSRFVETIGMMVEPEKNANGFRDCGVWVGDWQAPPSNQVPALVQGWCQRVATGEDDADTLYVAFERIHPFVDGNGRTGKILHNLLLGRLTDPVLVKDYFGHGVP